jgi:hypothetical protein
LQFAGGFGCADARGDAAGGDSTGLAGREYRVVADGVGETAGTRGKSWKALAGVSEVGAKAAETAGSTVDGLSWDTLGIALAVATGAVAEAVVTCCLAAE